MKDQRPYLIRALYEWIVDSDSTPYLVVNVNSDDVQVPAEHVSEGRTILNISPSAVRSLSLGNERVEFDSRFSGRQFWVSAPVASVVAIYARETGKGMAFDTAETVALDKAVEEGTAKDNAKVGPATDSNSKKSDKSKKKPAPGSHLKIIK